MILSNIIRNFIYKYGNLKNPTWIKKGEIVHSLINPGRDYEIDYINNNNGTIDVKSKGKYSGIYSDVPHFVFKKKEN